MYIDKNVFLHTEMPLILMLNIVAGMRSTNSHLTKTLQGVDHKVTAIFYFNIYQDFCDFFYICK